MFRYGVTYVVTERIGHPVVIEGNATLSED